MSEHTFWETVEAKGSEILDKVKELIAEGNVRSVRVRTKHRVIAEFPLTVGVVGAVLAPMLAALGAIAALVTECSIEVERTVQPPAHDIAEPASDVKALNAEREVPMMPGPRAAVVRHPAISYFLLTFAISGAARSWRLAVPAAWRGRRRRAIRGSRTSCSRCWPVPASPQS